ncbi:flagellar hook-length control protein FliK [Sphingomonas beigongshangi]|uniref:flagellar hook-length control protein FliK n=1 Tax=Sphingomonas beigongshangi TaxID=2782540 RepID=UPI00193AFFE6|nr:flagellar hook-length control protein FliK [Sphingomonas beigongshangi]
MIQPAAALRTTAPGLAVAGAAPGDGAAFGLSMLAIGADLVPATAPAAEPAAGTPTVSGKALPVLPTIAGGVDPALDWLAAVHLPVPAPMAPADMPVPPAPSPAGAAAPTTTARLTAAAPISAPSAPAIDTGAPGLPSRPAVPLAAIRSTASAAAMVTAALASPLDANAASDTDAIQEPRPAPRQEIKADLPMRIAQRKALPPRTSGGPASSEPAADESDVTAESVSDRGDPVPDPPPAAAEPSRPPSSEPDTGTTTAPVTPRAASRQAAVTPNGEAGRSRRGGPAAQPPAGLPDTPSRQAAPKAGAEAGHILSEAIQPDPAATPIAPVPPSPAALAPRAADPAASAARGDVAVPNGAGRASTPLAAASPVDRPAATAGSGNAARAEAAADKEVQGGGRDASDLRTTVDATAPAAASVAVPSAPSIDMATPDMAPPEAARGTAALVQENVAQGSATNHPTSQPTPTSAATPATAPPATATTTVPAANPSVPGIMPSPATSAAVRGKPPASPRRGDSVIDAQRATPVAAPSTGVPAQVTTAAKAAMPAPAPLAAQADTPPTARAAPAGTSPAASVDSSIAAEASAPSAGSTTEPRRAMFTREVAGPPAQAVALAPSAAPAARPSAGVTAPAAQVFGAAIHAAQRQEDGPAALPAAIATPLATPVQQATAPIAADARPTLDMRQERWPNAMIDHIETLRDAADASSTRIRLVPDALGTIDIALRKDGDTLHVHFAADQASTRALLQDAQPQLVQAAEQRGIRLSETQVTAGGNAAGGQTDDRPRGQPEQPRGSAEPTRGSAMQSGEGQQQSRQQARRTPDAPLPNRTPRDRGSDEAEAGSGRLA